MEKDRDAYIYVLVDPRNDSIRYVGSTYDPKTRIKTHRTECNSTLRSRRMTKRRLWFRELAKLGMYPTMDIVEDCTALNRSEREDHWINYYLSKGVDLVNSRMNGSKEY